MKYLALAVVLSTCPAIDPGSCAPHANEQPFDRGYRIAYDTSTISIDTCTWCGKAAQ